MVQANIIHSTRDGNVTFYNIRVSEGDHRWTVQRRYKDFVALERQIKSSDGKLPDIQRRQGLEQYLSHLAGQVELLSAGHDALREFLAPDKSGELPATQAGKVTRPYEPPAAAQCFRLRRPSADVPGESSDPMLEVQELQQARRRSDSCPCVLQYMRPIVRSPATRASASRLSLGTASPPEASRSPRRRVMSKQRSSLPRASLQQSSLPRAPSPSALVQDPAQQPGDARASEAAAPPADHHLSRSGLEEGHEDGAVVECDVGEPWLAFLARASQMCAGHHVDDEPSSLFEMFRTTEDLGLAYASFARIFHLATTSRSQGGRRQSLNLTVDPPWVTDAPGRNWRYPYEPIRLLLGGNWKAKKLWALLDKRCGRAEYSPSCAAAAPCGSDGRLGKARRCLVVGAGPCGLRAAIELRLLGAHVTIIERRQDFSRINQLHLWSWLGEELKQLGARCIEPPPSDWGTDPNMLHIGINQLQTLLFKMALLLGVEVLFGVEYVKSEWDGHCWCACLNEFKGRAAKEGRAVAAGVAAGMQEGEPPISPRAPVVLRNVAVLLGANGFTSTIGDDAGMKSLETDHMKSESAIGLICNFARSRGKAESRLRSFSMAKQFYMPLFKRLAEETGAELENIVYTKGHSSNYFVMTPTKRCLIETGVVIDQTRSPALERDNLDLAKLDALTRRIAAFPFKAEGSIYAALVEDLKHEGSVPGYADSGPALFDFSKMRRSAEGLLFIEAPRSRSNLGSSTGSDSSSSSSDDEDGHDEDLLVALVGDSLIEPFWPEGLGISRGFFGVWDVCAAIAEWTSGEGARRVMQIFQEAYVQLKSLGAATRARVLVDNESGFALQPRSRYRVFDPNRRRTSFAPVDAQRRRSTFAFDVTSFATGQTLLALKSQRSRSQSLCASTNAGHQAASIGVSNNDPLESQDDVVPKAQPLTKQETASPALARIERTGRRRVTIAVAPTEKREVLEDQARDERNAHHRERLMLQQKLASLESQLNDANGKHERASETHALFTEAQHWRAETESLRAQLAGKRQDKE